MTEGPDVQELSRRCREETDRYLRGEASNERFCFELFRRAIVDRDQSAWSAVYAQYASVMRLWVNARMDEEEGLNAAFERFWRALDAVKFARFGSLAAVLGYLKMCVQTAVLDHARAQRAAMLEQELATAQTLAAADDVEAIVAGRLGAVALWEEIQRTLDDERERFVLYLSYVIGLSPREIQRRYSARFPQIDEIYRLKRSALDRLRRTPALQAFLPVARV